MSPFKIGQSQAQLVKSGYVALSRARSLGGLSLARPLRTTDIRVDRRVVDFMAAFESDEQALRLPAPTD
jgi:hypothetical protein